MGLFDRLWRSTDVPDSGVSASDVHAWLVEALGGQKTATGLRVSPTEASKLPDVRACIREISHNVGRCPVKLRIREANGDWIDAGDRRPGLWEILHDLPNPETTAVTFRTRLTKDVLTYERAFAEIIRDQQSRVTAMWRLNPAWMRVARNAQGQKVYAYTPADGSPPQTWVFNADKPPILELEAESPVREAPEIFGLAMALDRYAAKFFANGVRLSGVLKTPKKLSDQAWKRLRESFAEQYGGVNNAHKVPLLEEGTEFVQTSASNTEAQFSELRRFVQLVIAGLYGVPPHRIGAVDRSTSWGSGIEQQDRAFVNGTLDPYFVLWEQAMRRDVLSTRQYPGLQMLFDREALIQADLQSRLAGYGAGRQTGIWSVNDIRRKLGENPIPAAAGGELYHMNGNMIPLTGRGLEGRTRRVFVEVDDAELASAPHGVM